MKDAKWSIFVYVGPGNFTISYAVRTDLEIFCLMSLIVPTRFAKSDKYFEVLMPGSMYILCG